MAVYKEHGQHFVYCWVRRPETASGAILGLTILPQVIGHWGGGKVHLLPPPPLLPPSSGMGCPMVGAFKVIDQHWKVQALLLALTGMIDSFDLELLSR